MTQDGGPAFPTPKDAGEWSCMTLRDYFASHANDYDVKRWLEIMGENNISVSHEEAKYCYADAMLHARSEAP